MVGILVQYGGDQGNWFFVRPPWMCIFTLSFTLFVKHLCNKEWKMHTYLPIPKSAALEIAILFCSVTLKNMYSNIMSSLIMKTLINVWIMQICLSVCLFLEVRCIYNNSPFCLWSKTRSCAFCVGSSKGLSY